MSSIIAFNPAYHMSYVHKHLPHVSWEDDMRGIVACHGKEIMGVVLFYEWTYNSAFAHVIITDPMCLRRLPEAAFSYAFLTTGRKILYGNVRSDNEKAIKFDSHLGFTVDHVMKDFYEDGVDNILFRLDKEDCRYIMKEAA